MSLALHGGDRLLGVVLDDVAEHRAGRRGCGRVELYAQRGSVAPAAKKAAPDMTRTAADVEHAAERPRQPRD